MSAKQSQSVSYSIRTAVAVALGTAAIMAAAPRVFAADEAAGPAPTASPAPAAVLEEVTVTGSRIRRKDLESQSPLVTIDSSQLESKAGLNLESYLNNLPQYNPAQTPTTENEDVQPSATNTVGISTISLRGLGPNRSLVLIDGHRTTPVNELMVTDINTIPAAMIDRVEIISGGASAVYGADALGGVTNFILKKNFQGVQVDAQDSITQAGDGNETRVSTLMGTTIADGKGNLIMGAEYYNRQVASAKNRSFYTDSWNDPNALSTNNFNLGLSGYNSYQTTFDYPSNAALNSVFQGRAASGLPVCAPSGCFFQNSYFNYNGTLFTNNGSFSTGNFAGSLGNGFGLVNAFDAGVGNTTTPPPGSTTRPNAPPIVNQLKWNNPTATISEPQTRYSFFANGTYDITDKVQFYTNARFANSLTTTLLDVPTTATFGWEASVPFNAATDSPINPALINPRTTQADITTIINAFKAGTQGTTAIGGVPIVNPGYIPTGTQGAQHPVPYQLAALLLSRSVFGAGIPLGALPTFPPTEQGGALTCGTGYSVTSYGKLLPSPCSPATTSWVLGYTPGPGQAPERSTVDTSTSWQIETGLKFPLMVGDWTGEAYYSRGQSLDIDNGYGNDSLARWRAVIASPDYGNGDTFQGNANGASTNFGTSVPTNCTGGLYSAVFSGAALSSSCSNAISELLPAQTTMQQDIVEANFQGSLFKLPGGDVSAALGYQYRRDAGQYNAAGLQSTNSFLDQAIGLYPQGSNSNEITAKDGYAELFVPILQDVGIKSLNLDIGGRYSSYNAAPSATTFKVNVDAALTRSFRLRAGFNRATRAPNLGELYLPLQEFFLIPGPVFGDPCSTRSRAPFGAGGAAPDISTTGGGPTTIASGQTAAGAMSTYLICQAMMGVGGAAQYYGASGNQGMNAAAGGFAWVNQVGNTSLHSETADTITAGFVFSSLGDSPWISGLSGSVDWWQIHINNAIELYSGDYANYLCFGTTTVTNAAQAAAQAATTACQNVGRNQATGATTTALLQYSNLATIGTAGVDVSINYFAQLSDLGLHLPGGFQFSTQDTLLQYYRTKQSPQAFDVNTDWKDSLGPNLAGTNGGAYGYRLTANVGYVLPTVSFNLNWRFFPSVNSVDHASQQAIINNNLKAAAGGGGVVLNYTPDRTIAAPHWYVFDFTGRWTINKWLEMRGGIDNLLNRAPAITSSASAGARVGFSTPAAVAAACGNVPGCVPPTTYTLPDDGAGVTNAGFYDVYGRTFFLGLKAQF